jgi:hypothetical protein
MKVKTKIRGGRLAANHNATVTGGEGGIKVKTRIRAGRLASNRNVIVR